MNAIELTALSRFLKDTDKDAKEARKAIVPGCYPVDITVRVRGEITVQADYEHRATQNLSPLLLAALAIKGRGATKATFKKKLGQLMAEAIRVQNDPENKENAEVLAWVEEGIKEVKDELDKHPKKTKKGSVLRNNLSYVHVVEIEPTPLVFTAPLPVLDATAEAENILDQILDEPVIIIGKGPGENADQILADANDSEDLDSLHVEQNELDDFDMGF